MRVITIANIKGGSTKSTTAIHLAQALSEHGPTLLVDMDPQASATDFVLADADMDEIQSRNVYSLLLGEASLKEAVWGMEATRKFDFIPGVIQLSEMNLRVLRTPAILSNLKKALQGQKGYKYVIIDTPGSLGAEFTAALLAADQIIIPVTPSRWTLQALSVVQDGIEQATAGGKKPKIALVPTMFGTSKSDTEILEEYRTATGFALLSPIPKSASIQKRTEAGEFLQAGSGPDEAFKALAAEVS